jgi:hypothetical protein
MACDYCKRQPIARSLCNAHYQKWYKGAPLVVDSNDFKDKLTDFLDLQEIYGYVNETLWARHHQSVKEGAAKRSYQRFMMKLKKEKEVFHERDGHFSNYRLQSSL